MVRPIDDDAPFVRGSMKAGIGALRQLRHEAERWASARGFSATDSGLLLLTEGIEVTVAFSTSVAEICTLRAQAVRSAGGTLKAEPNAWDHRIVSRLSGGFSTGDRAFDEAFHVATDSEATARLLLDDRARDALLRQSIWSRLLYEDGRIEVLLDSGAVGLRGAHLLAAVEVAVALARATASASPPQSPYR